MEIEKEEVLTFTLRFSPEFKAQLEHMSKKNRRSKNAQILYCIEKVQEEEKLSESLDSLLVMKIAQEVIKGMNKESASQE